MPDPEGASQSGHDAIAHIASGAVDQVGFTDPEKSEKCCDSGDNRCGTKVKQIAPLGSAESVFSERLNGPVERDG